MIAHGNSKVLFDPFFRNGFNNYDLMPAKMEADMFAGAPPWNGIDAIFISHYHGDHFDPAIVLEYLSLWPEVQLYAPEQAMQALRSLPGQKEEQLLARLHSLDLERDSDTVRLQTGDIAIEAIRVAHAGWPDRHGEVQNIAFRVTLDEVMTVVHLGDADSGEQHYVPHTEFWQEREADLALTPVWLLLTDKGRHVLTRFVDAEHLIGVHVYSSIPDDANRRPPEFKGLDIFTRPGETRQLQH